MKFKLTLALLTTTGTGALSQMAVADAMETVTITAHRPDTMAARQAEKVLSTAERAIHREFARSAVTSRVSDLWIFPTNDLKSVFVQYELRDDKGGSRRELALVELDGERVTRIVDLNGIPESLLASSDTGR
jgi:hypothetical protein